MKMRQARRNEIILFEERTKLQIKFSVPLLYHTAITNNQDTE